MARFKVIQMIVIIAVILTLGTIGFHLVEPSYSFFDSFYMTVITVTTIGYGEIKTLSTTGRLFNLGLIAIGWIGIFMVAKIGGQMIVEGQLLKILGRRKMDKKLSSISKHYIICGYGRVGRVVCDELHRHKSPFVVIERDPNELEEINKKGYVYFHGDCTDDQALLSAGIEKARGLINAVANEADAVYITLSARTHNPDLFIMARADSQSVEQKLRRAGADRVISPHIAAGTRMALAALRPNVVDFMSIETIGQKEGLRIEEVVVSKSSILSGKSFKELDVRAKYGLNIIGLKKLDGKMIYNPPANQILESGDTLFMVGGGSELSKVDELCGPSK